LENSGCIKFSSLRLRAGHEISGVFLLMVVEVFYSNEMYHNYEKKPLRIYGLDCLDCFFGGLDCLHSVEYLLPSEFFFSRGKETAEVKDIRERTEKWMR